jgi:hypothetical protein
MAHNLEPDNLKWLPIAPVGRAVIETTDKLGVGVLAFSAADIVVKSVRARNPSEGLRAYASRMRSTIQLSRSGLSTHSGDMRKKLLAGAGLPAAVMACFMNADMIQHGLSSNPNEALDAMELSIGDAASREGFVVDGKTVTFELEKGTEDFMNDSRIPRATGDELIQKLAVEGTPAAPFTRELVHIEKNASEPGFVVGFRDAPGRPSPLSPRIVTETAQCETVDQQCVLQPHEIILDENEGYEIGATVNIRGEDYEVVAFTQTPHSLIHREVGYVEMDENPSEYYGVVALTDNPEDIAHTADAIPSDKHLEMLTIDELKENNKKFWDGSSMPLVLLMDASILGLGAGMFTMMRRNEQTRDAQLIGMARAVMLSNRDVGLMQQTRLLMQTVGGASVAWVAGKAIEVDVLNKVVAGFHTDLSPTMVAGAAGLVWASQTLPARWTNRQQGKIPPAQLMKQA